MKNELKIAAGFLAGATIGLITGVLFAPDKGSRTRTKLKRGFEDLEREFEDTARRKIEKAKRELSDKVDEYRELGKKAAKELKDTVKFS